MNRRITYASQLANSIFALQDQDEQMFDLHCLIDAILGDTTELNGFACTPTMSPSLVVNVAAGQIYSQQPINATDFGTPPSIIPADSTLIMKFAYTLDPTPFTFVPPVTVGYSRNDLIQIAFQEIDGTSTGLSFFGGTTGVTVLTPTGTTVIPVANNAITNTVNVERLDNVVFNVKAGIAAPTGTQTTPTPDAGYTGVWIITTNHGEMIGSDDIAAYPGAPFILEKLKDKAGIPSVQNNAYTYAAATGTANALVVSVTPALTARVAGLGLQVKASANNTGATTINDGLGIAAILKFTNAGFQNLEIGDIFTNKILNLYWDGSNYLLSNPGNETPTSIAAIYETQAAAAATFAPIAAFTNSLGSAGYQDFEGGLRIQWGLVTVNTGASQIFSLPAAFGAAYTCYLTYQNTSGDDLSAVTFRGFPSPSQIQVYNGGPSNPSQVLFFAIGTHP